MTYGNPEHIFYTNGLFQIHELNIVEEFSWWRSVLEWEGTVYNGLICLDVFGCAQKLILYNYILFLEAAWLSIITMVNDHRHASKCRQ